MKYENVVKNQIEVSDIYYPISIMLKLTERCNLNCLFCSQNGAGHFELKLEKAKDILRESKKYGTISIVYSGGEPLCFSYISELIEYGSNLGLKQILVTNGIGLNKIDKITLCKLHSIGISVHGGREMHDNLVSKKGAFDELKDSLEYIKSLEDGPNVNLNVSAQ